MLSEFETKQIGDWLSDIETAENHIPFLSYRRSRYEQKQKRRHA